MKVGICSVAALISAMGIVTNVAAVPESNSSVAPLISQKHLVPYMEAEGNPNAYSLLVWLSPTRVAFTSNKDIYWTTDKIEKDGDIRREHLDAIYEILIFDTETGKTTHYRDGWLGWDSSRWLTSEDRKSVGITIELERVRNKNGADLSGAYDLLLKGPMGAEKPETRPRVLPRPLRRCPNNTDPETESPPVWHLSIPLKAEHGCLQFPAHDASPEKRVVYFRNDGTRVELDIPRTDITGEIWVEWLGAYLLGDSVERSGGVVNNNDQVLILMKPDGKLLSLQMNNWGLHNSRPTRAGMLVFTSFFTPLRDYGLYLWSAGGPVLVTEGFVNRSLDVSPDGCHVAYFWKKLYAADKTIRLRVIDVCRGVGVPADANPFNW